jgi:hypothetical protein
MLHCLKWHNWLILFGLAIWLIAQPEFAVADDVPTAELPITRVVLFNSGVGFYEHNGKIDGTRRVELKFRTEDVNDLLKSIVLQDLGGGQVSAVTYEAREPLAHTLKTFTIDLTQNPTLADLLEQARGERIQIEAPQPIQGVIVGVETRTVTERDTAVEKSYLDLKTETGLRSVPMDSIVQCRLLNKKLDAEFDEALALLAAARATDKKTVDLEFRGQGNREVRVGYIQESPVWKTSYRLVLNGEKPPLLQGWAIVENTGDQDWDNVQLSLVSGRPISFIMDLYQPLFVQRPTVVPAEFAGMTPQLHDQDLADREAGLNRRAIKPSGGFGGGSFGGGGFGGGFGGGAAAGAADAEANRPKTTPLDPSQGVKTAADAGELGELFRYNIKEPLTLARHKSAMLPIINAQVQGKKVSIYNADAQAKHPANGFQLTNSTNLYMSQGPIAVFDGGEFAGDARVEDVAPGAKRLISYAVDLDVEVAPDVTPRTDELLSVRIAKGILKIEQLKTRRHSYAIKNSSAEHKTVLVELPIDSAWELRSPKEPTEKTRDLYRFEVIVDGGKSNQLIVEEQQKAPSEVQLAGANSNAILALAASTGRINPPVEKAMRSLIELQKKLETATGDAQRVEANLTAIDHEQGRIRQNLAQLEKNSDLYNRYIKKLTDQEDEIERARKQLAELREKAASQRAVLEDFVLNLNVD